MKRKSKIILTSSIIIGISIFFSVAYFQSNVTIVERCIGDTVYKDFTGEIIHRQVCIFPFTGKIITDTFLGCDEGFKQINETCIQIKQEPEPDVIEERFHGLTKSQITDIQQAELGCKKIGNQTYFDIMVQEKIDYYLQQNQEEIENEN